MNGDFSRDTSRAAHLAQFSRVCLQQGRTLLDADFNEQVAIFHDYLRMLTVDMAGRGWRPQAGQFSISGGKFDVNKGFQISAGHFYVDGILCDNPAARMYADQIYLRKPPVFDASFIAYIECWERHVNAVQWPALREIALGGPDTASRAQVVWQVRAATAKWVDEQTALVRQALTARQGALAVGSTEADAVAEQLKALPGFQKKIVDEIGKGAKPAKGEVSTQAQEWLDAFGWAPPRMRAVARRDALDNDACNISPDSGFRGRENQLYRVEIHAGGVAVAGAAGPTFKWSRENGSVMFATRSGQGIKTTPSPAGAGGTLTIALETLGHDRRTGLCLGDRVEATSDVLELAGEAPTLGKITKLDRTARTVVVELTSGDVGAFVGCTRLRRWDQTEHLNDAQTIPVVEGAGKDGYTTIERGIQIQFQPGGLYRTGDYWLIPARVASGDIIWPAPAGEEPVFVDADGIVRHRTALGLVAFTAPNDWKLWDAGKILDS